MTTGPRARQLRSKTVYQGRVIRLDVDRVAEPGGVEAVREVVRHTGSVVLLPVHSSGKILLVRQFRYAVGQFLWELAAGRIEPGESVAKASRRELKEETGLRAGKLARLLTFFPSPGFLDEKMHLVRATELKQSQAAPEEDERIRTRWFSKRELRDFLQKGKIRDGKTLVGLLWHLKRGG